MVAIFLCAALAVLVWFLLRRGKAVPASAAAVSLPTPTASPTPAATSPSPTASLTLAPSTEAPVAAIQAPERTPIAAPPLQKSALERSLYQGSLSIAGTEARGELSLTYVNNGTDTLYALNFHLYPNAFLAGSLAIEAAALNGVRAYYYTPGGEGSLLCVPLVNELRPGESARVFLRFRVRIPKYGFAQAPAAGDPLSLLAIFPTAAVYENGWVTQSTPDQVDFAPLADWRLVVESSQPLSFAGGEVTPLSQGRYLCTAQAALPTLVLA